MNEDAEKWIAEHCDGHNERMIAGLAMRWAYADAARIVRVKPGTDPTDIRCGQEGIDLLNDIADNIEERMK